MLQNIVICGGGINIVGYIGVLSYLNEQGLLSNIKNYYGTSAGAIVSVMLGLGYTIDELKKFIFKFDFKRIMDDPDPTLLIDKLGLCSGNKMEIIAQSIVSFKLGVDMVDYSLKQLYEDKGINIVLCSYDITNKKIIYFDKSSIVPIWKALIASCCIPFIFKPYKIDNIEYIDGGICDNFPIHLIDDRNINQSLAIYCGLLNNKDIREVIHEYPLVEYMYDLMTIYVMSNLNTFLKKYNPIIVNITPITTCINFDVSQEQKQQMYDIGYQTALEKFPSILEFWNSKHKLEKETQTD
uniref:PNPLA domain-containing protein n=1 Tax=viral metagenome TaxID=1070528 RepID=A0A6C0LZG8_9ZZZZ